jgi:two-component system, chemotaxis family, protein-glutamate methylesterase/glutaminase
MTQPIKVFIVDDSAVVRSILTEKLDAVPGISVAGSAMDPFVARDKIARTEIDVILLDIEMPRMDGLPFLKHLMKSRPIPTIILSSLADGKNEASMKALELGAVGVIGKPGGPYSVTQLVDDLVLQIRAASTIDMSRVAASAAPKTPAPTGAKRLLGTIRTTRRLIAVGASTGGTVAMERLFMGFPADSPPTVAVIHMPGRFTATFSRRLDELCAVRVKEAEDGEPAMSGCVYMAPGNYHLVVKVSGAEYVLKVIEGPRVQNQRPAVDVLFRSVAENVGKNAVGVILTGMGRDGADGLLKMHEAGAYTIGQDEASSVVYGMPKEAFESGAVSIQLPLERIAAEIMRNV